MSAKPQPQLEKGLPANPDAERFVLGSILLDGSLYDMAAETLEVDDFSQENHRLIFRRMGDLHARGEHIDHFTVSTEAERRGERDAVGGFSYVASLDDGLPRIPNLDSYVRIVKDKATLRKAIFACEHMRNRCLMAEEEPGDILEGAEKTISLLSSATQRKTEWYQPGQVVEAYPGGVNAFFCPPRGGVGIPTPWEVLTEKLAGLHPGDLFVIAGRPSMGKSVVAMLMAHHAASVGETAAVFSLEMSKESLVRRMVASVARLDHQDLRTGKLNREERARAMDAYRQIYAEPLYINDEGMRTCAKVTAALRKLRIKAQPRLIVLDHLQLMASGGRRSNEQRNQEVSEIVHEWKYQAKRNDAVVLLLSQLNRQCEIENRRPQLSDLAETGAIEQDADGVMFIHRPERYVKNHDKPELRGYAEFILAKQRDGATGKVVMRFLHSQQRFEVQANQEDSMRGPDE